MTANECLYSLASIPCTSNNNPSPDSSTSTSSTPTTTSFQASTVTTRTTDAGSADDQCSQRRQLNAHRKQQNASRSSNCRLQRRPCRQHWLPPSSGLLITALLSMLLAVPGVRLSDQRTSNSTSAEANGTTTTTATTTTASSTIESNDKIIATLLSTANMPAENYTTPTSSIPWFSSSSDDSRTNATQVPGPNGSTAALPNNASTVSRHFQLISFNWAHVQTPISLSLWLLLASIAKIFFNMDKRVAEAVPDSALLIVLGLALGSVLQVLDVDSKLFTLPSSTFFLYLLPPIIFDAGYFMPNRQLFENFDSVLLFAIVGTIWNTLAIGYSLFWLAQLGCFSIPFTAFQILLFASLISAVDPVAVIAVFEQIHINEFLFINVFGEALFNDGVSVVLYQMFRKFILIGEDNLLPLDYMAGIGSFFVIAVGGVLIGLLFAVIASLATKYTRSRVSILAPVFVFVVPYISYLAAEMFGLSSILAIVACGIAMKQYVKGNLSQDAANSVKYFIKMLAQCSETVIFMFLGLSAVSRSHDCDWVFVLATIGFCLLFRIIGVVVQCFLLNRFRTKKFSFSDQFVLSYGGLRGAIAFGLVVSLDDNFPAKQMFVTSCIAVIFFTVFVQGITIRPLLHWLHVEKQDMDKEETMIEKIYTRYCDYMMAGLEDITGQKGRNAVRDTFERFNSKVLKPALMRGQKRTHFDTSSIVRAYRKIIVLEAHRLSRVSFRKKRGGPPATARVGPAHSPSSATSTLTMAHSNCWTTTTGGTGSLPNGSSSNSSGGIASANGGGMQKRSVRLSESSDEGQQHQHQRHLHLPLHLNHHNHHNHHKLQLHETPLSSPVAHSQQSSEDGRRTVSMQHDNHANNLGQQYLAQPESAELLYELARKLRELRQQKDGTSTAAAANEVVEEEDLMEELEKRSEEDDDIKDNYLEALQPKNSRGEEFLSPTAGRPKARPRKQQQQPKQRRRCSLSPSLP